VVAENAAAYACYERNSLARGHVIIVPRRKGDVPDPAGGVRCVLRKME